MQQVASQYAPSPEVVVPFFGAGSLFYLAGCLMIGLYPDLFVGHYFSPGLLAITHLLVLGWVTMIIMGALSQLIPVILERPLHSEVWMRPVFLCLLLGTLLLAGSFWHFYLGTAMWLASVLLLVAAVLFAVNVFLTARRAEAGGIARDFILSAVVWLLFTVLIGVTLALNLRFAFLPVDHLELLKLHAHAGLVGWVMQLIIGVGSRLLPMFFLVHDPPLRSLQPAWYLLNPGLLLAIIGLWTAQPALVLSGALSLLAGIGIFLRFAVLCYRRRLKKRLDPGMRQTALAFALLVIPPALLIPLLTGGRLPASEENAIVGYGSAIIIGFFSALILGQSYKTLPFIVWLAKYRARIGRSRRVFPGDLYSTPLAHAQMWSFAAGFALLLAGIFLVKSSIVRIGGLGLSLSAICYVVNIFTIIFHKVKDEADGG